MAEPDATPDHFTLYEGTALALRLGHRQSVDFDFFSRTPDYKNGRAYRNLFLSHRLCLFFA
jgi:hypothetical protein